MKKFLSRFVREEEGQGMVEYGLIIAAIAVAVIAVLWLFGEDIVALFEGLSLERPAA